MMNGRRKMGILSKRKDPYEYITPDNFELIKQCLVQGLHSKDPLTIVKNIKECTDIPEDAIMAIVSQEIGQAYDAWRNQFG